MTKPDHHLPQSSIWHPEGTPAMPGEAQPERREGMAVSLKGRLKSEQIRINTDFPRANVSYAQSFSASVFEHSMVTATCDPDGANSANKIVEVDGAKCFPLDLLSPRQKEVYRWVCEGKRDREIATILGISYRTVTVHVRAILKKLGAENRTCAAMMAVNREEA